MKYNAFKKLALHYASSCNSCNTGMSALPDMYTQAQGHATPKAYQAIDECLDVLQLKCDTSGNAVFPYVFISIMGCNGNVSPIIHLYYAKLNSQK